MKKKLAVLGCALVMISLFTVVCFADEAGADGTEKLWDFWGLLSPENVNYLGLIGMLLTTISTFFKIIGFGSGDMGGALKNVGEWLKGLLDGVIPTK